MPISESIQQAAWRRLKKNKGAVFGMIVIALSVVVAISAYFLAAGPFAVYQNRMMVEIAGQSRDTASSSCWYEKPGPWYSEIYSTALLNGQENRIFFTP